MRLNAASSPLSKESSPPVDLTRCRTLMVTAAAELMALPGSTTGVGDGYWLAMSGVADADMNMALIHTDDRSVQADVVSQVQALGVPALLMLAGDARSLSPQLPSTWQPVGELPVMAVDLAATPTVADERVRAAGSEDTEAIISLICDAFGTARDAFSAFLADFFARTSDARWWLLEDDGAPVSTVWAARVEDSVSLWCMATPPRFARRGYARALLAAVLDHAAKDGATVGLLGATPAGYPLYEATGWTDLEHWQIHLNGESVQFH